MQAPGAFGPARITRVRLRTSASADTLQQRLRATSLVERTALGGGGLPLQAVLVLRRLQAPLPHAVLRSGGGLTQPADDWQGRLRTQVERAAAHAARVVCGAVPADAPAVWFADRAELLSCLAGDWLAGRCADAWWWRLLLGAQTLRVEIAAAWTATPRFVPQAFQHLAQAGLALRFVEALPAADVEALTQAVLACHGLESPAPAGGAVAQRGQAESLTDRRLVSEDQSDVSRVERATAPAITALGSATLGLEGPRAFLLAIALALVRWPSQVRQPHFVDALSAALAGAAGDPPDAGAMLAPKRALFPATPVAVTPKAEEEGPGTTSRRHEAVTTEKSPARFAARGSESQHGGADVSQQGHATRGEVPGAPAMQALPPTATRDSSVVQPLHGIPAPPEPQAVVHSAHGGVFFLLNLTLSLGLYSDFTRPRGANLALPLWDLLALCANAWLSERGPDEVLPGLLAQLAGRRPHQPPGTGIEPPRNWRLPAPALRPWGCHRGAWRWQEENERLQVLHPAGFVILDVERNTLSVRRQLAAEAAPYRAHLKLRLLRLSTAQAGNAPEDAPSPWCAWLLPLLAHRLALAVGLQDTAAAARRVCCVPARIALSPARLDVHMHLADLPIAVRRAGLDRDPGWIPAAGRELRFHFEAHDDGAAA